MRWLGAVVLASLACSVLTGSTADAARTRADACGPVLTKATGGSWSCTFVDDFTGTTLNASKWLVWTTAQRAFTVGGECNLGGDDKIRVAEGVLRLTSHKLPEFDCATPTGSFRTQYTGAMVTTESLFSQAFGRFEARIAMPTTRSSGLGAAFWMWPREMKYGHWPGSGEIDVAERFSGLPADRVSPSLHYSGRTDADTAHCVLPDDGAFHTYAVEWTTTRMRFVYDGKTCLDRVWAETATGYPNKVAPFDTPFHINLGMGATPNFWWNQVAADTPFPASMSVDYVKVWK